MPPSDSPQGGTVHRSDLEGLRGFALSLVLLFHFDVPPFTGGFIGVDIFFVLSGYLISRNTRLSLQTGIFSFSAFYCRRIARLAPALLCTIAISTLASVALLPLLDARDEAQSATAAVMGISNVLFFFRSGYFDTIAIKKPLLHTWSLGIETQFYFIWPLVHFILHWLNEALPVTFATIFTVIGAVTAEKSALHNPSAAFFLPNCRAWEFLMGALLALQENSKPITSTHPLREAVALSSMVALLSTSAIYRPKDVFPGIRAIIPCISTVGLIYTQHSCANKFILSSGLLRFLGKISYGVYLLHWPLLVHWRAMRAWAPLTNVESLGGIFLSLLGGYAVHTYIERPFMQLRGYRNSRSFLLRFVTISVAIASGFICIFFVLDEKEKAAKRSALRDLTSSIGAHAKVDGIITDDVVNLATASLSTEQWIPLTKLSRELTLKPITRTFLRVAIVGDSHAARLQPLAMHLRDTWNIEVYMLVLPACPPLSGVRKIFVTDFSWDEPCESFNQMWVERVKRERFDIVFLAARWESNLFAHPAMESSQNKPATSTLLVSLSRDEAFRRGLSDGRKYSRSLFGYALQATAKEIQSAGAIPVLFSQAPVIPFDPRTCSTSRKECSGQIPEESVVSLEFVDNAIEAASNAVPGTKAVLPSKYFCKDKELCRNKIGNAYLYDDNNHLSTLGGAYVALQWQNDRYSGLAWRNHIEARNISAHCSAEKGSNCS